MAPSEFDQLGAWEFVQSLQIQHAKGLESAL
jgi:hypothetical protein